MGAHGAVADVFLALRVKPGASLMVVTYYFVFVFVFIANTAVRIHTLPLIHLFNIDSRVVLYALYILG